MFHVEGGLRAEFIRQGTGTRSWPQALGAVRRAERLGVWEKLTPNDAVESSPGAVKKPVAEAIVEYLEDCASVQGKHLSGPRVGKYQCCPKQDRVKLKAAESKGAWVQRGGGLRVRSPFFRNARLS
jgi:hypothetical protein